MATFDQPPQTDPIVNFVGAFVVGFARKQIAPVGQLEADTLGIVADGPVVGPERAAQEEGEILEVDAARQPFTGDAIPVLIARREQIALAIDDAEIPRSSGSTV